MPSHKPAALICHRCLPAAATALLPADGGVAGGKIRRQDLITAFALDEFSEEAQKAGAAAAAGGAAGKGSSKAGGGGGSTKKRR